MTSHPPGPDPLLSGMKRGQTIPQFMTEWGSIDTKKCDEMIERVIRFLKQNVPIRVAKVVKGGPMCKDTFASTPGHVDLFLFINDLSSMQDMKSKTRRIVKSIRAKLDSSEFVPRYGVIQFIEYTPQSMKLHLRCHDLDQQHTIEVFPAYDILKYKNVHDVYIDMSGLPDADKDFYAVCLAEIQIDYIRQAPSKVHTLIRILKYWLKEEVKTEDWYYFLEVMAMHRWQRAGKPHDFDISDWFEEIMTQLADLTSLSIIWEDKYTASNYRTVPSKPVVLDPANPHKNVVPDQRCCEKIMKCARAVVTRSQALKDYIGGGPAPIIEGMARGETLQHFIQHTIQPSSDDRRECDHLVERVTNFLQHKTNFGVSMVVKGGSLGKSTNVLGKSDVDMVVFINDVSSVQHLQDSMKYILDTLKETLDTQWSQFAGSLKYIRDTSHGIQYQLGCGKSSHVHDVDILPAFNILEAKQPRNAFEEMKSKTPKERAYYSVCFAQKQVAFVKEVPIKVKNFIRLLKYWAKVEINREQKAVTSYFLELVAISFWKNRRSPDDFNTNDWFKEIMTQLADLTSLRILWPDKYTVSLYYNVHEVFPKNPVVLDPANPYINVAPLEKHHSLVMTCAQNVLYRMQAWKNYRTGRYADS
ncbi:2'-5'-oligoadenylate synthase 2-like [Haliotis rubra]|uniref:2'-5'-oligoadenylate synthase 2-like n=1 Tax=Haliotis rubra TaxID=36100 RepID=UPI001EE5CBC4|nr:2'-5'-oligoadenylate synthase 2-like [Haliotis rubra]